MSNTMTKEEIREALGLMPFDEFREKAIERNKTLPMTRGRILGRTTQMLVEAVYHAQSGKVAIKAWSPFYEKTLYREACEMCITLGLEEAVKNIVNPDLFNRTEDIKWTFEDHYIAPPNYSRLFSWADLPQNKGK